jgi:hypothetical protein
MLETETNKQTRRKVIPDTMITSAIYEKLMYKVCATLEDKEITQHNIMDILIPLKISNATIARVVNDLIPTARATAGSIASQIKARNSSNDMINELLKNLEI